MQSSSLYAFVISFFSVLSYAEKHNPLFDLSLVDLIDMPISGTTPSNDHLEVTPSAITVFNRQQIEYLGVETLAELANLAPGFQVLRSDDTSGYSALSMRGRTTSHCSTDVLLLVDGKRTLDFRLSSLSTHLTMSLFNVERVEFIRGTGASLYGSGAMMGIINVITRENANEIVVSAGNLGRENYSVMAANDIFSAQLNYSVSEGDHYMLPDMFTGEPVHARDPEHHVQALFELGDDRFELAFRYSSQSYSNFYALQSLSPEYAQFMLSLTDLSLVFNRSIGEVQSRTSLVVGRSATQASVQRSAEARLFNKSEPASFEPYLTENDFEVQQLEAANQSIWNIDEKNRLIFGGSYYQYSVSQDTVMANYAIIDLIEGHSRMRSSPRTDILGAGYSVDEQTYFGLFGQWQVQPSHHRQLTFGMRMDYSPEIRGARISPRITWKESLGIRNNLKFIYGEAYRIPSINERGIRESPFVTGNENLDAESVKTSEIIWVGYAENWNWSLGYFYSQFDDTIAPGVTDDGSLMGSLQYVNQTHDSISGVEAEATWQPGSVLMLSATSTLILDRDERAYQNSTTMSSVSMNVGRDNWNISVSAMYRGPRGTSPTEQKSLAGYWLNLSRLQVDLQPGLQLFVEANNLFDDRVYYPAQSYRAGEGMPSRGRELLMGIKWNYR